VQIGWIQLLEFRNYRTLTWKPSAKLNVLVGLNAQGKTNLLEALGFLLAGRSFRTPRLADLPLWGSERALAGGELLRSEGARTVRRVIQRAADGSWRASGDDCPWARAIAFGWQDLEIIHGGPTARRTFLDGFAARLQPSHRAALVRYRQVLERRNHLLQQRLPFGVLVGRIAPWDEQLATVGMELIARRRMAAASLQTEIARVYPALTSGRPKVEVRYRSTLGESSEPAAMIAELERRRPEEARRAQTVVGPHRDDLAIELDGLDARAYGSRGQQRLLALALRLAEILPVTEAAGTPPVLLLDDALSELDARARASVLREVEAAEQVFLTTPDALLTETAGTRWVVNQGGLEAA
jgi:DNA replication and repair protein RecF